MNQINFLKQNVEYGVKMFKEGEWDRGELGEWLWDHLLKYLDNMEERMEDLEDKIKELERNA